MCFDRYRYVIVAVGFLCLVSLSSNPMVYNMVILCMKKDPRSNLSLEDGSVQSRFEYTKEEEVIIYWAVAAGTIIGAIPGNFLYIYFGARWTFFVSGIISAVATAAVPIVVYWNFWVFIAARFLQGIGYSADFAAVGLLLVRWASIEECALFIGILTSFNSISTVITNVVSGVACDAGPWQFIWYGHAIASIILFALWPLIYTDDLEKSSHVTPVELEKIQRGKTKEHIERDIPIVLVTWLNCFCELVVYVALSTYLPLYFDSILGFSPSKTGIITGVMQIGHLPVKILCAYLSDHVKCISEVSKLCIANTIAVAGCGIVIAAFGLTPPHLPGLAVAMAASYVVACGTNCAGFYKCVTLVCRQYSHFVLSNMQFSKCIALFVAPLLKAIFVGEEIMMWDYWRNMWVCYGVILFVVCLLFCFHSLQVNFAFYFVVTDQPADFTKMTRETACEGVVKRGANMHGSDRHKLSP